MCGIFGIIDKDLDQNKFKYSLEKINNLQIHRGPDDSGSFIDYKNNIGLAHRRLSILDLSKNGSQPMLSGSKNLVLVFNGEIYNHSELKKKLDENNISLKGYSDTEILLELIEKFGLEKTLNLTVGMFAFALYDKVNLKLILARDRIGEKPLYYYSSDRTFIFGSEINLISKYHKFDSALDINSIKSLINTSYIKSPSSIYANVKKILPGTFITVDINTLTYQKHIWWSLIEKYKTIKEKEYKYEDAIRILDKKLDDSFKLHINNEVPTGILLSGGIDSSLVAAKISKYNSKLSTHTIAFENTNYDESKIAKKIANILETQHNEYILSKNDVRETITNLHNIFTEPFADSSQIATVLLSKYSSKKIKIALSGDGGDEIFGGYNRYFMAPKIFNNFSHLPINLRIFLKNFVKIINPKYFDSIYKIILKITNRKTKNQNISDSLLKISQFLDAKTDFELFNTLVKTNYENDLFLDKNDNFFDEDSQIWNNDISHFSLAKKMMILDGKNYLADDILVKIDRSSMFSSLENRAPLLDHRIIEYAISLPLEYKVNKNEGKLILKKILNNYLPNNILENKKMGFHIPIKEWLRNDVKEWAGDLLSESIIKKHGLLDHKVVNKLWKDHINQKSNNQYILWNIINLNLWLDSK